MPATRRKIECLYYACCRLRREGCYSRCIGKNHRKERYEIIASYDILYLESGEQGYTQIELTSGGKNGTR